MNVKKRARITTTDGEIDAAIECAKVYEQYRPQATKAAYRPKDDIVAITLSTGVGITIPRKLLQGLEKAAPRDAAKVTLEDYGSSLHWESLDVDHYIPGLISGIYGTRKWMSELGKKGGASRSDAKQGASRENGRKGGRPRKTSAA
jgi:hypothetical protein